MSFPVALPSRVTLGPRQYALARAVGVLAAWTLPAGGRVPRFGASPRRLAHVLHAVQRGARRPSTAAEAEYAVLAVCTANLRLGGTRACLPRTVAALLYCRAQGHTPVLVLGVRPGTAQVHAWLEAEGRPAGEPCDPTRSYTPVVRYQACAIAGSRAGAHAGCRAGGRSRICGRTGAGGRSRVRSRAGASARSRSRSRSQERYR